MKGGKGLGKKIYGFQNELGRRFHNETIVFQKNENVKIGNHFNLTNVTYCRVSPSRRCYSALETNIMRPGVKIGVVYI